MMQFSGLNPGAMANVAAAAATAFGKGTDKTKENTDKEQRAKSMRAKIQLDKDIKFSQQVASEGDHQDATKSFMA